MQLEMEHSRGFHVVNWDLQDAVDQKHNCDALCNQKGPPEWHKNIFPADPKATVWCSAGDV